MTKILWFTWKDKLHPLSGGAEVVTQELTRRLVQDGNEVIIITSKYKDAKEKEICDGVQIIRVGNRFSVYWKAYRYYRKHLRQQKIDIVIDEMNTIPFLASFYTNITHKKRFDLEEEQRDGKGRTLSEQKEKNSVISTERLASGETSNQTCKNKSLSFLRRQESCCHIHTTPKHFLFVHQLCREIWFYQIIFPLNLIGYLIEPMYLWLLRKNNVITVSESTKKDLMKYGFDKNKIQIISEGVHIKPLSIEKVQSLHCHPERSDNEVEGSQNYQKNTNQKNKSKIKDKIAKYNKPTILSLGAIRKMKRTDHQLKAFEIAKKQIPDLQFKISGQIDDEYGKKILQSVKNSKYSDDIEYLGKVSNKKKKELMQKSHIITVTSIKEGWGLIVTEANSQGTSAIVYDVDGLRDSVNDDETGMICNQNTPEELAKNIVKLLKNKEKYDKLRQNAWKLSKKITFKKSYQDFCKITMK